MNILRRVLASGNHWSTSKELQQLACLYLALLISVQADMMLGVNEWEKRYILCCIGATEVAGSSYCNLIYFLVFFCLDSMVLIPLSSPTIHQIQTEANNLQHHHLKKGVVVIYCEDDYLMHLPTTLWVISSWVCVECLLFLILNNSTGSHMETWLEWLHSFCEFVNDL